MTEEITVENGIRGPAINQLPYCARKDCKEKGIWNISGRYFCGGCLIEHNERQRQRNLLFEEKELK